MFLLAGLGNPGSEYADTRHNVGFMAVDEIVRRYSFTPFRDKFQGQLATGTIAGEKVLVLKPTTFMNLSGQAVAVVCSFYKLTPDNVIVFHDDMDLPVGKVKVKRGGSAGGHNGLKSIDAHIGPAYMRVRIGTDKPADRATVVDWVLHAFPRADREQIDRVLGKIADQVPLLLQDNMQTFMNRLVTP